MDEALRNKLGQDRIASRQVDELIGLARGIAADGTINLPEAEFLQKWLAANQAVSDQPMIRVLFQRVSEMLSDNVLDTDESSELLDTLNRFSNRDFELGEVLKSTTLPFCDPAPVLQFENQSYCFTGTFSYGQRKHCEAAVVERGAICSTLTQKTNILVIGLYATESWKHSSFGNKILKATEWRNAGKPIRIVSEQHWVSHL